MIEELEAAEAELAALLPDGETKKVMAAQAKVSALAVKLGAQKTRVEQLRDQLEAERAQSARKAKLGTLRGLADQCTEAALAGATATEKAEAALDEYVRAWVASVDAQNCASGLPLRLALT